MVVRGRRSFGGHRRRRGRTVWIGGVTADLQGSGQRPSLSAAREGFFSEDGLLIACPLGRWLARDALSMILALLLRFDMVGIAC